MENTPKQSICHPGTVERQKGSRVYVRIESQSSCGNCRAKSYCGMVESTGKIIEATRSGNQDFTPGQKVEVVLESSLGYRALFLGYILPFLIIVAGLFLVYAISGNEAISALVAVLLAVPYYYVLYRNKGRLRERFRFHVKPAGS